MSIVMCQEKPRIHCEFGYSMANSSWAPWCQATSTEPTRGKVRLPSWSLFLIVRSETLPPVMCWRSFRPVISSCYQSYWQIKGLLRPRVTACLLHPGGVGLCATSVRSTFRLMLPVVTLTLAQCKSSGKNPSKKHRRGKISVAFTCKTIPVLGVISLLPPSAPLVTWTPKQLKLIKNNLCYLTDQIIIPEA